MYSYMPPQVHVIVWNNVALTALDVSRSVEVSNEKIVAFYGNCTTGTGTLTLEVSPNGDDWYEGSDVAFTTAGSGFHAKGECAESHVRIRADQNMTGVTCFISAK